MCNSLPTVTAKVQKLDDPAKFVKVHVTIVCPVGKVDPDAGLHCTARVLASIESDTTGSGQETCRVLVAISSGQVIGNAG